ncbi:MAG: hypothetical protein WC126_02450, partial [Proteiniphilum sp.]
MNENKDKSTAIARFLNGTYTVDEAYIFLGELKDPDRNAVVEEAAFSVWEESQFVEKTVESLQKQYKEEAYALL